MSTIASPRPAIAPDIPLREQLAKESAKPLFMETAMKAVFSGIFGPAPIPTEENSATAEP